MCSWVRGSWPVSVLLGYLYNCSVLLTVLTGGCTSLFRCVHVWELFISVPFWCFVLTVEVPKAPAFESSCDDSIDREGPLGTFRWRRAITQSPLPLCACSFDDDLRPAQLAIFSFLCHQLPTSNLISSSHIASKITYIILSLFFFFSGQFFIA